MKGFFYKKVQPIPKALDLKQKVVEGSVQRLPRGKNLPFPEDTYFIWVSEEKPESNMPNFQHVQSQHAEAGLSTQKLDKYKYRRKHRN